MNLFFLDFETTGLNPYFNDPIEIAIKKINDDDYYQSFIIPKIYNIHHKYVPPKIIDLTNIDNDIIENHGKEKRIVINELFDFIKEKSSRGPIYIVSHNGNSFDFIILRKLLFDYKPNDQYILRILSRIRYIDSLLVSKLFLEEERVNQPGLCKKYNIHNELEHRAIGDIKALEKLYIKLCEQYSYKKKYSHNYYLKNSEKLINEFFI